MSLAAANDLTPADLISNNYDERTTTYQVCGPTNHDGLLVPHDAIHPSHEVVTD